MKPRFSRSDAEKFFEPPTNAIIECINNMTAETGAANTVSVWFPFF